MGSRSQRDIDRRRPTGQRREPTAEEIRIIRQLQAERKNNNAATNIATGTMVQIYARLAANAIERQLEASVADPDHHDSVVAAEELLDLAEHARRAGLYFLQGLGLGTVNEAEFFQPDDATTDAGKPDDAAKSPEMAGNSTPDSPIVLPPGA